MLSNVQRLASNMIFVTGNQKKLQEVRAILGPEFESLLSSHKLDCMLYPLFSFRYPVSNLSCYAYSTRDPG